MNKQERTATLVALIEELKKEGSWCGETHIQKTAYILQVLLNVPLGIKFILYKHGPFSFELQDELSQLRGDELLSMSLASNDLGSYLEATRLGLRIAEKQDSGANNYATQIRFVAQNFGKMTVKELERLGTALYVTKELGPDTSVETRANRVIGYKPHVKLEDAINAVIQIDGLYKTISQEPSALGITRENALKGRSQ